MTTPLAFGAMPDGTRIEEVALECGGLSARIITWGAVVRDLRLAGHAAPLVLGFETLAPYLTDSPHFGAIAGRYANRIRDGRFVLDGQAVQVDRNFQGRHHLHGGSVAFGKRAWRIVELSGDAVTLQLDDPAGSGGFPGALSARCTYRLGPDGTLEVLLEAATDAPTICNLAQHSYFNLDDGGAGDVLGHRLRVAAEHYLAVDDGLIPVGDPAPVAGTPFDYRADRPIGAALPEGGLDHNFCLAPARGGVRPVAWLAGAGGVSMTVETTEPGLQVYAGAKLNVGPPGLGGRRYGPHAGIALEPQAWPDAPNRPEFPQATLRPGETYRQLTRYRFALKGAVAGGPAVI